MAFRLLGPIEAYSGERAVPLGGAKPRALLAMLLLEHDRVVTTSRLIDVVWGEYPPETARGMIQTYVSTLRQTFARFGHEDLITRQSSGYVIRLGQATLDRDLFEQGLHEGRQHSSQGDFQTAVGTFQRAEALWHGAALTGLDHATLVAEARRLDELRMAAVEERIAAQLSLGGHDRLIAELTALVGLHPANERLRGQLMLALFRLGRQADSLACYREGREALIDEVGVEPGAELNALHSAILRGDASLLQAPERPNSGTRTVVPPAQLPAAPVDFTGRIGYLDSLLNGLSNSVPIQVIAGQGGCGKSALAVAAAHRGAVSFPDGQLYAELRGMSDTPAQPGEVLGRFLRALGVDAAALPESVDERAELYRTLLANRKVLVVLDDAGSELQVRPLLPGSQDCAVIVTSRDRLAGLAGAVRVDLEVLDQEEAEQLLSRIAGPERLLADPESTMDIVAFCASLPLAIRIVGARLASRRQLPLKVLAARLADERQRLNELSAGESGVRSSIGLSYQALDPSARAALRLLGFLGVPDFSAWLIGSLLDTSETEAERLLEMLVDAQLVEFAGLDNIGCLRYRLHDLVRLFGREQAKAEEQVEDLTSAVARTLTCWLALIDHIAADSPPAEIQWRKESARNAKVSEDVIERVLSDHQGWLDGEQAAIVAGVERAAELGLHQLACEFGSARTSVEYEGVNRFEFRSRIVIAALGATQRAADRRGEAIILAELARLQYDQDHYAESRQNYGEALGRFRELGDVHGQAGALAGLGIACREPGYLAEAVHFLDQAALLLEALRDDAGIGYVLRLSGSVRLEQGDYPAAWSDLERSVAAYERANSRRGIAYTQRTQGLYHRARGELDEAARLCTESLATFTELGDERMRSYAIRALAKTQVRQGRCDEALPSLEWALSVARKFGDRWGQAAALRVMGQLHFAEGRLELAESCYDASLSLWETIEIPLWRARTDHDLSLLHRARGELETAEALRASALKVFHHHGAREHMELVAY